MKEKTNNNQLFTPRGLTQNWNFIEESGKARKGRKGGAFVSRKVSTRREFNFSTNVTSPKKEVDTTTFTSKVDGEEVKVLPRKNGKFSGKQQVYSKSLAKKLGLV